eukprot:GHVU01141085.1.p2 GENE.GHVU01141085.1~~GHVU01141085.1.p2  ORF type:complete len:105 (-),score=10.88 GHVU01141085.1:262-576(-)
MVNDEIKPLSEVIKPRSFKDKHTNDLIKAIEAADYNTAASGKGRSRGGQKQRAGSWVMTQIKAMENWGYVLYAWSEENVQGAGDSKAKEEDLPRFVDLNKESTV